MHIEILQPITHPSTPRPFLPHELVTVPDELAREWIAEGRAVLIPGVAQTPQPARRQREKALRG